jgi:uncharacterized protein
MIMLRLVLAFLLILLVVRALWRVIGGVIEGIGGQERRIPDRGEQMVRDPVCGTFVLPDRAVVLPDGAKRVFFCSTTCRDTYQLRGKSTRAGSPRSAGRR